MKTPSRILNSTLRLSKAPAKPKPKEGTAKGAKK
jgi:hypothetical protein